MKLNVKIQSKAYVVSLISALVTFIVYLPSLMNDFVSWDDNLYIFNNENIKSLNLGLFKWAFSDVHTGNWHPLAWISHAFDYAVWGMNPAGHHLTSVLFHAVNTYLLTRLSIALIEIYRTKRGSENIRFSLSDTSVLLAGTVTGLLFGLHPIHVESVAWVSERKDVLYSFFILLSLLEYIRHASELEEAGFSRDIYYQVHNGYTTSFLLFVPAVLSKPMAVTFPAVLLILDWFPFQRMQTSIGRKWAILEKIPFFMISLAASCVAFYAQGTTTAVVTFDAIPLEARTMNAIKSLVDYLIHIVWPIGLMPLYPHPYDEYPAIMSAQYIMPALAAMFLIGGSIVFVKRQKIWLAVWASYIIMLLPVLGMIQVGVQGMADRYMYLPSIGPFLLIGTITGLAGEKIIASAGGKTAWIALLAAICLCFVLLSYGTKEQIHIWKDGVTLWSYELDLLTKKSSKNWYVIRTTYENRAYAHMMQGNYESEIDDLSYLILHDPNLDVADQQRRALAYARLGRYEEAIKDFNACILKNPNVPEFYYNRGTAYAKHGSFKDAVADLTKAISISTSPNADYYMNRGNALKKLGRLEEGERDILEASKLRNASSEDNEKKQR